MRRRLLLLLLVSGCAPEREPGTQHETADSLGWRHAYVERPGLSFRYPGSRVRASSIARHVFGAPDGRATETQRVRPATLASSLEALMRHIPIAVQCSIVCGIAVVLSTAAHPSTAPRSAQSPQAAARPDVRLPDDAAGIDAIALALIAAFDQVDIVALGEAHLRRLDSDLRIAIIRHPDFAKKVRTIVIECGSIAEQTTLDRYIR